MEEEEEQEQEEEQEEQKKKKKKKKKKKRPRQMQRLFKWARAWRDGFLRETQCFVGCAKLRLKRRKERRAKGKNDRWPFPPPGRAAP